MDTQPAIERSERTAGTADEALPQWLADAWPRVVSLVALSIVRQTPADRTRIYAALDRGALEYCVDDARRCVYFGVEGMAFCAFSFDVITDVRSTTTKH
jgi:hypothetical protein